MSTLNELLAEFREIEDMLIESGGELTPEIEKRLDQNNTDIETKLDNYANFIQHLKGQAEAVKTWEDQLKSRRTAIKNSIDQLREHALYGLISTGQSKIKTAFHSFSVRETRSWKIRENIDRATMDDMANSGYAEWEFKPRIKALQDAYGDNPPKFIEVIKNKSLNIR